MLCLNVYLIVNSTFKVFDGYKSLEKLRQEHVYMGNNQATSIQENKDFSKKNIKKSNNRAQKIFNYVDTNFKYSMHWDFDSTLSNKKKSVDILTMDRNALNFYNVNTYKGLSFKKSDFRATGRIPVLLGYNLKKYYNIGDSFKQYNPANGESERYVVRGFLEKNSKIQSVYMLDSATYLNDTIIRPLTNTDKKNINATELFSGIQDLIVYDSPVQKIKRIVSLAKKDNFLTLHFYSINNNIQWFFKSYVTTIAVYIIGALLILVMSLIFTIWNLKQFYKDSFEDLTLRYIIGMEKKQIYRGFIIYQMIIESFSLLLLLVYIILTYNPQISNGLFNNIYTQIISSSVILSELLKVFVTIIIITTFNLISVIPIKKKLKKLNTGNIKE